MEKIDSKRFTKRFERKFAIEGLSPTKVKSIIKLHPAFFREIYEPRQINNIYLDTVRLSSYFDNTDGNSNRKKVRIRWYGQTFGTIRKPVLEYKKKTGLLGSKPSWNLTTFCLNTQFDQIDLQEIFANSELPKRVQTELQSMYPKLLNTYKRTYYQSFDKKFRITVDEGLTYFSINSYNNCFLKKTNQQNQVILELKYTRDKDDEVDQITQYFPFRLTKSSKYVNGINFNRPL